MPVFDIIQEEDDMKAHEHHFILWPRQWKKYLDTHNWQTYRLDTIEKDRNTKNRKHIPIDLSMV